MEKSKVEEIGAAIVEARRFILAASLWKKRIKNDKLAFLSGSKGGGAAKRASMDLTRF